MKALNAATEEQLARTVKFANITETGYQAFEGGFAHMAQRAASVKFTSDCRTSCPPSIPLNKPVE